MPPKPVACKEDIFAAALSIVRSNGLESVNARSIAQALGCSTKPLFRLYKNMDELKQDVLAQINRYCSDYLHALSDFNRDYIGVALRYISFAKEEPYLFKALFMSNTITQATIDNMLIDDDIEGLLNEISTTAQVNRQQARRIYKRMWLLSHGIAAIIAANGDIFELEETESILNDAWQGFVLSVKCGGSASAPMSQ